MKQVLLLFFCLMLSVLSFGQVRSADSLDHIKADNPDHITIVLKKDSVHIRFKDQSFKVNSIQDLDSWLKENIAKMTPPDVDLVSYIALTPQKHRELIIIMDKYRCPVVSEKTISDGKPKIAGAIRLK